MKDRDTARFFLWIVLTLLAAVLATKALPGLSQTWAQSPMPTDTPTLIPPSPTLTDTPFPPANTPTPVPPTNTPPPPTSTPMPIPPPPQLGSWVAIDPPSGLVAAGTSLGFTVAFTEPQLIFLNTVTWVWGDGDLSSCTASSGDCTFDPLSGLPGNYWVGTVANNHIYSEPGVYAVQVMALDIFGQFDTSTFEFAVVSDPTGGFVSGGGWIDSQPGAYKPDPALEGKATFGFVSKYKKGASVPSGYTHFQFKAGDLSFHSDRYDWLVVSRGGSSAQFKGSGTINGALDPNGNAYKFMLWAGDGSPDTVRIKIWYEEKSGSVVVYDNGFGQPVGGGSIVIHSN